MALCCESKPLTFYKSKLPPNNSLETTRVNVAKMRAVSLRFLVAMHILASRRASQLNRSA